MNRIVRLAAALAAPLAFTAPAYAALQQPAPVAAPAATVDEEEQLDEALKRFGYLAGLAQVCVKEEQRPELEREVLNLANSITRLLGGDRAFLFSASYGYGTSVEVKTEECAEVLRNYEARVAKHRAAAGGTL